MADELPHLQAYLALLPDGLDSYPDVKTKASLYRSITERRPLPDYPSLPAPLRTLAQNPVPVSAWIPTVHHHALTLASRDLSCRDDDDFRGFCHERQRALFDGPLYSVMLAITKPRTLLRSAARRWTSFHRGTSFVVEHLANDGARIKVGHSPHLLDGLIADALIEGLTAVIEVAGGTEVKLIAAERGVEVLRIEGSWII
ncbi:MAG: hypothetical protein AAGA54_14075 [Myxococcota bacterium]